MCIYNHIYKRVEYPRERGYRMEPYPLPRYMYITIEKGDSKRLIVHSRIHVNEETKVGPSYSNELSDAEIIKDLSTEIAWRFL